MNHKLNGMVVSLLLLAVAGSGAELPPVTLRSLLADMVSPDALARWPVPAFTCTEASSHDPSKIPGTPGWFANNDCSQYVRIEQNHGNPRKVMMDVDGPGVISRFWLTANPPKDGHLCIFLDGAELPAITFPAFDLMSGGLDVGSPWITAHPGYQPAGQGGNTLYLPIPYAKHCMVVWQGEDPRGTSRYYQINYRTYPKGTAVETWSLPVLAAARADLRRAGNLLEHPPQFVAGHMSSLNQMVAPGAMADLDLPTGTFALRQIELRIASTEREDLEYTLRSCVFTMSCDGEQTVWCPVSDFFGSGVGVNELRSCHRTVQRDGTMTCRWTMPYRKQAKIGVLNLSGKEVALTLHACVGAWTWDEQSMHFRCNWRQQTGILSPPFLDWNYLKATGRGVYVGDSLTIFNPIATWYGEGDEKIFVDNETMPSHIGTGTEDYYNYSYAPKPIFQTPFANLVRMDQEMTQGYNVCSRTRFLDAIPFTTALNFDMEIMPWRETHLTYAATTYWYGMPGAISAIKPMPAEAQRPIQHIAAAKEFPGALECERMDVMDKSAGVTVERQDMEAWGVERWSAGAQLLVRAHAPGNAVALVIPATDNKKYRIVLHATCAVDYGTVRLSIDGESSGVSFDGYATSVSPSLPIDLGVHQAHGGHFILHAQLTGKNAQASGDASLIGLDCVVLGKIEP
jgi:hypothetical protein